MKKIKRLIDLYDRPFSRGIIFDILNDSRFDNLFVTLGIDAEQAHSMDVEYIFNNSGLKSTSTLLNALLNEFIIDDNSEIVTDGCGVRLTYDKFLSILDDKIIRNIIYNKFFMKWEQLANTLFIDYDVTSPYNMEVNDNSDFSNSSIDHNSRTNTTSKNNEYEDNSESSNNEDTFGFNSSDAVPADKSSGTGKNSGTSVDNMNSTDTENNQNNRNGNTNRKIIRKGNIGNRSVTELINEKRDMLKYQIFSVIFSDLDSVLTRSKYI